VDELVLGVDFRPYLTHPTPPIASSDKQLLLGSKVVDRVVDIILSVGLNRPFLPVYLTSTAQHACINSFFKFDGARP
jgi:hypothetical protein